jgi:membrane-associated phospholipid phosphatase
VSEPNAVRLKKGKLRRFNFWIVGKLGIKLNTFPSGHVTATLGSSLVVHHFLPRVGLVFILLSLGIALAAVLKRYHYAADIFVAVGLTILVYAVMI